MATTMTAKSQTDTVVFRSADELALFEAFTEWLRTAREDYSLDLLTVDFQTGDYGAGFEYGLNVYFELHAQEVTR